MTTKREFRNGEIVDVTYDENGEEILWHWVHGIRKCSGRYPWPKTKESEEGK